MAESDVIRSMVTGFRITELQALLTFAGKNRTGRKTDLQKRALELVRQNSTDINQKVRELSAQMYKNLGSASSVNPYSTTYDQPYEPESSEESSMSTPSPSPSPPPKSVRRLKPSVVPQRELRQSTRENSRASTAAAIAASSLAAKEKNNSRSSSASGESSSKRKGTKDNSRKRSSTSTTTAQTKSAATTPKTVASTSSSTSTTNTRGTMSQQVPSVPSTPTISSDGPVPPVQLASAALHARIAQGNNFLPSYRPIAPKTASASDSRSSSNSSSPQIVPHYNKPQSAQTLDPYFGYDKDVFWKPMLDRRVNYMYPTFPDVKLRPLPFNKVIATLMQPCSLQPSGTARFQEQKFSFYLSPLQAGEIAQSSYRDSSGKAEYKRQILLRFSLLETSCEQDDNFPSSVSVKVNNKLQPLPNPIPTNRPGVEPKRPPKPLNITPLCKLSATCPNYVDVSWAVDFGKGYTVSVYYVDRLSASDLLKELRARGTRLPDFTRALIKEKLNDTDGDIATTSCKVTLACPLGKMRMTHPCRANTCDHLQCFDASLYLMMNERKPKWLCPVCNKPALFENLLLDGFFKEVLASSRLPSDDHEIVLHNDGSWDPLPTKKDPASLPPKQDVQSKKQQDSSQSSSESQQTVQKVEALSVDEDEKIGNEETSNENSNNLSALASKKEPFDCIVLDSSDDEDTREPVRKRAKTDESFTSPLSLVTNSKLTSNQVSRTTPQPPHQEPDIICIEDD